MKKYEGELWIEKKNCAMREKNCELLKMPKIRIIVIHRIWIHGFYNEEKMLFGLNYAQ